MENKKISRLDGWLLQSPDDQISNHSSYRSQNKWQKCKGLHTAGLDTIFVQIYMDASPGTGPRGVKKSEFLLYK